MNIKRHHIIRLLKYRIKSRREFINDNEEVIAIEEDMISLRFVFPMEMERLIEQNGFTILDVYGSWDKSSLQEDSNEMIFICKKV